VDYDLVPKIPFYFLRRAYTPVLVCFERTPDRLAVWVVNDSPAPVTGRLCVRRVRFDGAVVGYPLGERSGILERDVALQPGEAQRVLDTVALGPIRVRDELLQASFAEQEATCLLVGERHLQLPRARLAVRQINGRIEVSTDVFARQVVLEAAADGVRFEDNYFDLAPGQTRVVNIVEHAATGGIVVRAYNANPVSV
jgi:beta-mannosidase